MEEKKRKKAIIYFMSKSKSYIKKYVLHVHLVSKRTSQRRLSIPNDHNPFDLKYTLFCHQTSNLFAG